MKTFDSVFAGIGGQGILLAAEIVGTAALRAGFNVRVSELHGMAQRGGAVVSHVRIGEKALAPTVLEGTADVILGFEPMEALRSIRFASGETTALVNTRPVCLVGAEYPEVKGILSQIREFTRDVIAIDIAALAEKAGSVMFQNSTMLGALAATGKLPLEPDVLRKALSELVPSRHREMNARAFELGYEVLRNTVRSK